MTIASQTSRISYTGDGVTTTFSVPFYFAANADLVVILQDTSGNQVTQVLGTNYNLTGATLSAGGTCTFTAAPTSGYLVTIYRDPAVTQTTSYNNNDPFPAKSHELALDKLTTIAQRLKDQWSRAIKQTDGEAAMTTTLAAPGTRKNKLLGFDGNGGLIYVTGPTFVNSTFTGVAVVDTRATASATIFSGSISCIVTLGLVTVGDGGGATYIKGTVSSPGAFLDGGGTQYWGSVVTGTSGVAEFDTRATAAASKIASGVNIINTFGLATAGDGGGANYVRGLVGDPGAFQDGTGGYWKFGVANSSVIYTPPQGRLTLTSGAAIMGSNVAASTVVYYTPAAGFQVPIFDGARFLSTAFTELSQTTTDTTKSPAAVAANSCYDMFVWNDNGVTRCTRGPAWTNTTTRSAGTALALVNGIFLNSLSITNGPAASRGTYVGTICSNGTSTIDWLIGGTGSGGVAAVLNVWNAYNRGLFTPYIVDSTGSWTYTTANTWRAANSSTTIRCTFVRGLDLDPVKAEYAANGSPGSGVNMFCGIGVDSTTAPTGRQSLIGSAFLGLTPQAYAKYSGLPGIGQHFVTAIEDQNSATSSTWFGSSWTGLSVEAWQ